MRAGTPRRRLLGGSAAVVALATVVLALTGCSASGKGEACDQSAKRNVGLVAGSIANAPTTSLSASANARLAQSSASNGSVTVVVPSGKPVVKGTTLLGSTAQDSIVCKNDQRNNLKALGPYVDALKADNPEVDFLDAIDQSARNLGSNPVGVVVSGSGLQTADPLNFTVGGLLYAEPSQVVSDLTSRSLLPTDLKGVTVYWSGMGDVAGSQPALTIPARSNLEAIWSAVIKAAGGRLVLLSEPATGAEAAGLPSVSVVPVDATATKTDWTRPVVLHNSDLKFVVDKATFADPSAAAKTLAQLAPSIEQNNQLTTITGTASKDKATNNTADLALSTQRADAVASSLQKLGVPASLLTTKGVGHVWCGWQRETDANGTYSPALAEQNRSVILTSPGVALCG